MSFKYLSYFVISNNNGTRNIFEITEKFSDYKIGPIVRELRVVNDTAERGVALMQEFNALLTKDEEKTKFAIQVIKEHRKRYIDSKKETLLKGHGPVG